jgi:hypothetical protein
MRERANSGESAISKERAERRRGMKSKFESANDLSSSLLTLLGGSGHDAETIGFALALVTATWITGVFEVDEEQRRLQQLVRTIGKILPVCREAMVEETLH